MSADSPEAAIFYKIRNGTRGAAAMLAAMQLDLFTPLALGPLNPEQLAEFLGVNTEKLTPLLYVLAINDLLLEDDGLFSNTPETSEFLVKGKPKYMGNVHKIWYKNLLASLQTAETIRTGVPQAKYDWASLPEEELMVLYEGMAAPDAIFARWLSDNFEFSNCTSLLDAGGGSGTLAIALTEIHPKLHATVVDLPEVTAITEKFVAKMNAAEKVKVVAADLTCDPIPGIYDAVILSSVIQTVSTEEAQLILTNVGKVTKPGGWVYLFGSGMLEDSRLSPRPAVEFNLVFINTYDKGQSYTESQYRDWFETAGFVDPIFRYGDFTIIARKRTDG